MANIDFSKRKREDKDGGTKLADVVNALRDRLDEQEVRARAQEDRFRKQDGELQNLNRELRQREISQQRLGKRVADLEEQMEEKEEELKELKRKVTPLPLWKILTDVQYRDIFETCIVPKLWELEFRVFREVNRESRDAIRRSGRELKDTFIVKVRDEGARTYEEVTTKIEGKHGQYYLGAQAARTGNLALLRWLREEKMFEWDGLAINIAAEIGHLHIVKYCMRHVSPINELPCALAAENGHLDILKYLHENGAPWDWRTCRFAAQNNHIECLNYAKENGCPHDDTLSSSESDEEESD